MKKLVHCIELINVETDLVSRMQNRRLRTSPQNDLVTCGWRVCLNAAILVNSIFEIQVCFILFVSPKYFFFYVKHVEHTQNCFYLQDPLNISNYSDLDVDEFRVKWPPMLVTTIRNRTEEEERMGPVWEQRRIEQLRRRHEEYEAELRDFHSARENFDRTTIEVNEWLRERERIAEEQRREGGM